MAGTNFEFPVGEEPDGVISYNLGDTATHEVGHWLGLDHTLAAGGCSHPGDHIKDTPTEAEPQFLCIPRDSCVGPQFRGLDPITNFMDYVDDVCMEEFTSDQSSGCASSGTRWYWSISTLSFVPPESTLTSAADGLRAGVNGGHGTGSTRRRETRRPRLTCDRW